MTREVDHRRVLNAIAGDTRVIAGVLIVVGVLSCWPMVLGTRGARAMGATAALVILGPGLWYLFAARMIGDGSGPVVGWSLRVACAQLVLFPVVWLVAPEGAMALLILAFFVPAQGALLAQLWRARHLIEAHEAARGFSVLVAQAAVDVQPGEAIGTAETVEEAAETAEAAAAITGGDAAPPSRRAR